MKSIEDILKVALISFLIPWVFVISHTVERHDKIIEQHHSLMCMKYPGHCKS